MRAVVVYGADDLRVVDFGSASPGPGEVSLRVEWGGICGSDLSYWKHGASGTARLSHPLVLGHEVAGTVESVGEGVDESLVGRRASVHPATIGPGSVLPASAAGRENLHSNLSYLGSAAVLPHVDGGFREQLPVRVDRLRLLPAGIDTLRGALAEPLGVAIHAVRRAGDLNGRDILVNGSGPIGALVIAAARHLGAGRITAADIAPKALQLARRMGADETVALGDGAELPEHEVVFEASGSPSAVGPALRATTRGGTLVQVGNLPGGEAPAALGQLVTREITWKGSYRFVDEITDAVDAMASGLDVEPIISATFPLSEATAAFREASTAAGKVMLAIRESEESS